MCVWCVLFCSTTCPGGAVSQVEADLWPPGSPLLQKIQQQQLLRENSFWGETEDLFTYLKGNQFKMLTHRNTHMHEISCQKNGPTHHCDECIHKGLSRHTNATVLRAVTALRHSLSSHSGTDTTPFIVSLHSEHKAFYSLSDRSVTP